MLFLLVCRDQKEQGILKIAVYQKRKHSEIIAVVNVYSYTR